VPIALPAGWSALAQRERSFKDAEKKRSLYVAATRAKNMLVLGIRRGANRLNGAWKDYAVHPSTVLPTFQEQRRQETFAFGVPTDFARAKQEIADQFERARESSYSVLPITKLAKRDHAELLKQEEGLGKGTSWGRVLHRLFEAMLRQPDIDVRLYAKNLLKDEERDAAESGDVLRVIEAVQQSEVWQRVLKSPRRFVEVPFAIVVPSADFALEGPSETLLHGVIDLVFEEAGEWYVVDYKSDSTKGRLEALVDYYKPQVEHYARFWSKLTGAKTHAGLFFVDGPTMKWV
jgi:ATP-dependent helicase/nuclease subunit A